MLAKCLYCYTDDYGFDKANNFGKTEWVDARELKLTDWDFRTKSGGAWENNGVITLSLHSNLSYELKYKEVM